MSKICSIRLNETEQRIVDMIAKAYHIENSPNKVFKKLMAEKVKEITKSL